MVGKEDRERCAVDVDTLPTGKKKKKKHKKRTKKGVRNFLSRAWKPIYTEDNTPIIFFMLHMISPLQEL